MTCACHKMVKSFETVQAAKLVSAIVNVNKSGKAKIELEIELTN